jgi:DNA-binding response OmpR family regulator
VGGTPVVLIVEDDEAICDMYCLALRARGHEVVTAATGAVALATAAEVSPGIVLLDMGLPDRPGIEVLRELKGDDATAAIPVLIVSNYDEPEIVDRALEAGALLYLVKADTTPGTLANTVERILAHRET